MTYGKFKDLAKTTQSDKVLRDKVFEIAKNPKYDGYQRGIASMVYKFFDEKSTVSGIKNDIKQNKQLANEKIKKKKKKGYSSFRGTIWGVDLADRQVISKYKKGIKFLLKAIDLCSKYAWVFPLKDKKRVSTINAFQKVLDNSEKQNQIKYGLIEAVNFAILSLNVFER